MKVDCLYRIYEGHDQMLEQSESLDPLARELNDTLEQAADASRPQR
jgi:hypothetical protein